MEGVKKFRWQNAIYIKPCIGPNMAARTPSWQPTRIPPGLHSACFEAAMHTAKAGSIDRFPFRRPNPEVAMTGARPAALPNSGRAILLKRVNAGSRMP